MSVGELEKKQQNTKKAKTTSPPSPINPKKYFTQEQAVLYQTPLQNLTVTHSILLPIY